MVFLVSAKLSGLAVPVVLKSIIDDIQVLSHEELLRGALLGLILAYGTARLTGTVFTELREFLFARVTSSTVRRVALEVFNHLHTLSLRFHLDRATGGMTRDLERGSRAISSLVSYLIYSILPTLLEITMVLVFLGLNYDIWFVFITAGTLVVYVIWSIWITEWRTAYRRAMNDLDSQANVRAVDSLLNYETVKYFGNEQWEAGRYDASLAKWEQASLQSQVSLSLLNFGQSCIIAVGVTLMLWRATIGVANGSMTLGDLVLVNTFMIQLYLPLNFLGVLYREIKQGFADLERMLNLLHRDVEIADIPNAPSLVVKGGGVSFRNVNFSYDTNRSILHQVNFEIPAGKNIAVVGPSGSGKSTLARLLFRFYDLPKEGGMICIDNTDIRSISQASLREAIGIVPQDTVLFNDTVYYNIAYGKPTATKEEVEKAAQMASLHSFIESLPLGYETMVGERGLKLSGGEKQRVAIARTILKNPPILILDEATSALDSETEQAIQTALYTVSQNRTTLTIAHRLSTIVDAHCILVMDQGSISEQGTHAQLLAQNGLYTKLWTMQSEEKQTNGGEKHTSI